jgi:hypothetical protein
MTLQPCMEYVDEWVSVSELEIADAMCAVLQHHSKLIEVGMISGPAFRAHAVTRA